MLIGIDGNEANEVRGDIGAKAGVNIYAYEILWGIYKESMRRKLKNDYIIYLKTPPIDLPPEKSFWRYHVISGGGLWVIRKLMPTLLIRTKPDVFFSPNHYLPPISTMPKVITIHDLGYLKFSEQFNKYDYWQLKYWTAISISISKYIISVSESTKQDIVRHYPRASKKIHVVHHGYDKSRFNFNVSPDDVRRIRKRYKLSSNEYLLFLSTLKPSKNIIGLLEAFKLFLISSKEKQLILVIAGKRGWMYKEIYKKVTDLKLGKKVVFTDFVTENDKPALLKGAKVLISPSFWEGFGLHILEALACGTPVIVSRVASVPEVAGDAGIYVNPESTESISSAIQRVLAMNEVEYGKLAKKCLSQAGKFSWKVSAQKTLNILEKAANGDF